MFKLKLNISFTERQDANSIQSFKIINFYFFSLYTILLSSEESVDESSEESKSNSNSLVCDLFDFIHDNGTPILLSIFN